METAVLDKTLYEPKLAEYWAERYRRFETEEMMRQLRSQKTRQGGGSDDSSRGDEDAK